MLKIIGKNGVENTMKKMLVEEQEQSEKEIQKTVQNKLKK